MTQEKLKRVVTAAVVGGIVLLLVLSGVIVWQVVRINTLNKRIDETEQEISRYEEIKNQNNKDLDYYLSEEYLEQKAYDHGFICNGDN